MHSSKIVALNADHRSMHKFLDIDDVNYKAVCGEIQNSLDYIDKQGRLGHPNNLHVI